MASITLLALVGALYHGLQGKFWPAPKGGGVAYGRGPVAGDAMLASFHVALGTYLSLYPIVMLAPVLSMSPKSVRKACTDRTLARCAPC